MQGAITNTHRTRARRAAAGAIMLLALAPTGASAGSAWGPHESVTTSYTTQTPGTSAGFRYAVTYHNPGNPQQHPPAVHRVVLGGPAGERIDVGAAAARCDASDTQLETGGGAACPAGSRIGGGTVVASTLGGPGTSEPASVYATPTGFVTLLEVQPAGTAVMRSTVHGATIDTTVPTCLTGGQPSPSSGCPFDEVFVLSSTIDLPALSSNKRNLITMPTSCPRGGWATTATFYYGDGFIEALRSTSHCRAPRQSRHGHKHARRRAASPGRHKSHQRTVTQAHDGAPMAGGGLRRHV